MNNQLKILHIEDNPEDIKLIQGFLSSTKLFQFDITVAQTLAAGCDILKKQKIDVILLDLILPDSQGFETFNTINQLDLNIPIIVLSGIQDENIAISTVRAGAQDYFVKGSFNDLLLTRAIIYAIERKISEAKIKEYVSIVENADEVIYTITLDGEIKTWNKAAERVYDYKQTEIIGQNISNLFLPKSKNEMNRIIKIIKTGGHISQFAIEQVRKDGKIIKILMTVSPILISPYELVGVSIIARDITTQNLSEQQLAIQYRIATILNESMDINEAANGILETICEIFEWHLGELWIVDPSANTLTNVSTWTDRETFHEVDDINKKTVFHINEGIPGHLWKMAEPYWVPDIMKDPFFTRKQLLQKLNLKNILGIPILFRRKVIGTLLFFAEQISNPDTILVMLLNIGEQIGIFLNRKQIELEQSYLKEELFLKNKQLEEQNVFLQQANQAKSTFLANMSHELRTPLNSVIGYTELMYKGKVGPVSPEHKEYLGEIAVNGRHLLHLINDILDLTKIESGKMEIHQEPTNLVKLVNDVRKAMQLFLIEKKINFMEQIDPSLTTDIISDPDKVKQILFNYLSNAIKFTPPGGKITVRIVPEDNQFFRLEITDTGIGISKSDIDKLFVMFGQLNISYSKPYQGIGLGLALTRHITELLGGRVGVVSDPGKGSTFFVILPLVRENVLVKEKE